MNPSFWIVISWVDLELTVGLILTHYLIAAIDGIEGNSLVLTKLTRADGGAYLCIAQNGVPSPVSKRIMIHVHCKFYAEFIERHICHIL